mmetsp:Transcript_12817/g.33254  ORF Transcript_12817/g.33254 Transcript_12817/m.33254 type:complete len:330 (+) Transcript_12817:71-1060(+)
MALWCAIRLLAVSATASKAADLAGISAAAGVSVEAGVGAEGGPLLTAAPLLAVGVDVAAAVASQDFKLYDCGVELEVWETAWTPEWKAWCCEHGERGCPSTSTTTRTTSTGTSTTVSMPEGVACDSLCEVDGVSAMCKDRIVWASQHEMKDAKLPCQASLRLVKVQCSICSWCSVAAAGCAAEARSSGSSSRSGSTSSSTSTSTSTSRGTADVGDSSAGAAAQSGSDSSTGSASGSSSSSSSSISSGDSSAATLNFRKKFEVASPAVLAAPPSQGSGRTGLLGAGALSVSIVCAAMRVTSGWALGHGASPWSWDRLPATESGLTLPVLD